MNKKSELDLFYGQLDSQSQIWSMSLDEIPHLRALRKRVGDSILLTDGRGHKAFAKLSSISKREVQLDILSTENVQPTCLPVLCVAPTKNLSRMEWMVEKLVEIGISQMIFFFSEHSERKHIREDRLRNKMLSAMKQSRRYFLPEIQVLNGFESLMDSSAEKPNKYIATAFGGSQIKDLSSQMNEPRWICIGPEGGFSQRELEIAAGQGWSPLSLGDTRLRTETAAIVACCWNNLAI